MKYLDVNCNNQSNGSHKGLSFVLFGKKSPTEIFAGVEVNKSGIKTSEVPFPLSL